MEISELEPDKPIPLLGLELILKQDIREWNGNKVCSCTARDASGECILSLWNNDVESFEEGDFIVIKNGWCKEYRGDLQVSSGKYGSIDLIKRPLKEEKTEAQKTNAVESQMPLNWHLRPTINEIRHR